MSSWHGTSIQAVTPKPSLSLAVQTNSQQQKRNMGPTLVLTKSDPRLTDPGSYHPQTNSLQLSNTSGHSQIDLPHVAGPNTIPNETKRSPVPKVRRRMHTGNEKTDKLPTEPILLTLKVTPTHISHLVTDFQMTSSNTIALWELQQELNMYILYRLLVN